MEISKLHRVRYFFRKKWLDILFIVPLVIFVLGFTLSPIISTIKMGFQNSNGVFGLESYQYEFQQSSFYDAIVNTLVFTAIALVLQLTIGFFLALLLKQTFHGRGLVRAFVLLPMGVPTLVSGVAMLYVFSTSGYLNEIIYRLGISSVPVNWTGSRMLSMLIVSIADSWKVLPIVVLMLLAGLESVPNDLYEAAEIDGAGNWNKFHFVTLPQIRATVTMTVLMRVVDLLRVFEMPQVLLGQGTPFMGTLAYSEFKYGNNSYSAVISTVLLVIIIAVVGLYLFVFDREKGGRKYGSA